MFRKTTYILYILQLLVLFFGCSTEFFETEGDESVEFNLSTRAVVGETIYGITISKVRILISDNSTNHIVYNGYKANGEDDNLTEDPDVAEPNTVPEHLYFRIKLKKGNYTAFAVINETDDMSVTLKKNPLSVSDISAIKHTNVHLIDEKDNVLFSRQPFSLRINPNNPNFGQVDINDNKGWKNELYIEVKRVFVKFSLYLRKKNSTTIVVPKNAVTLKDLPTWSYLVDGKFNSIDQEIKDILLSNPIINDLQLNNDDDNINPANYDSISSAVFSERYFENATFPRSSLALKVLRNGVETEYTAYLGDEDEAMQYPLERNVHYKLLGTVTSNEILFTINVTPWKNWDATEETPGNGIKNGTIQQPTANTLNTINDGETIYLLGLLERDLVWDWRDGSKYTFDKINTLTLNFSGVKTNDYSVEVKVPEGFTIIGENPSKGGKITIKRDSPILLEPTSKQLNFIKNGETIKLYGTLATNVTWDWAKVNFTSLEQNGSFTLDFSNETFNSGQSITLQLPENIKATGTGLTGSNPYTVTATPITITNHRVNAVIEPIAILDVVADHSVINVNGGNVSTSGETWDWSEHSFANLDPQESFTLAFSGVTFNGPIGIKLPSGFRAYKEVITKASTYNVTDNTYNITDNGRVTIKNNKIIYPPTSRVNALSDGAIITIVGETLDSDANLDWSNTTNFTFPNLPPQAAFTLDASGVDFATKQLTLSLPEHFALSQSNSPVSNPYTFKTGTSVVVRNDRIQKPSNTQLNNAVNGSIITMTNGRLFMDEQWDWSMLPFTSLGRLGNSFTLAMSGINLNGKSLSIKLPPNCVATGGNVSAQGNGVYKITSGTGNVVIIDNRILDITRSVTGGNPSLTDIVAGQRVILTGSVENSKNQMWEWNQMPSLSPGQWFEIDYSRVTNLSGSSVLYVPIANATYVCTGAVEYKNWGSLMYQPTLNNGLVRFTKQYNLPAINDAPPAVTGGEYTLPAGTIYGPFTWSWTKYLAPGAYYKINFNNITFDGTLTVTIPSIHTAMATGSGCSINGTTLTISGPCVVTVTCP